MAGSPNITSNGVGGLGGRPLFVTFYNPIHLAAKGLVNTFGLAIMTVASGTSGIGYAVGLPISPHPEA